MSLGKEEEKISKYCHQKKKRRIYCHLVLERKTLENFKLDGEILSLSEEEEAMGTYFH